MAILLLIRHGRTQANSTGVLAGIRAFARHFATAQLEAPR